MVDMRRFALLMLLVGVLTSCPRVESKEDMQLWVMIKMDSYFRTQKELKIVDELANLIEQKKLGLLDGHSSGGHQFEVNFYEISDFATAKSVVESFINDNYPKLSYIVSNDYEMLYETL